MSVVDYKYLEQRRAGYPSRYLTRKEKLEKYETETDWAIAYIDSINYFGISDNYPAYRGNDYNSKISTNLALVEDGVFNAKEYEYLLTPLKTANKAVDPSSDATPDEIRYPVRIEHYDIISPKINVLLGEEIVRPYNYIVVNLTSDNVSETQKVEFELISSYVEQKFLLAQKQEMAVQGMPGEVEGINNPEKAEVMAPSGEKLDSVPAIKKYMSYSYSDTVEKTANDILNYQKRYLNLEYKFNSNFRKFLASGIEIYYVGEAGGEMEVRVVDPRNFGCVLSPDSDFIEEADCCWEDMYLTIGQVQDMFYDSLTEEDMEYLAKLSTNFLAFGSYSSQESLNNNSNSRDNYTVKVTRYEWLAGRRIGFLSAFDDEGNKEDFIIDEDYKFEDKKEEKAVEWKWVNERWEGYKIGEGLYTKVRPIPGQLTSIDNVSKTKSRYVGFMSRYSLVDKLVSYQALYNIVMLQLKLALARAKGKVLIFDVAQIPKKDMNLDKWMYLLDTHGIAFINSLEKNEQGERTQFNQFTQADLSLGNTILGYIQQLDFIKREAADITGITPQRVGQIQSRETLGGVERSVNQSAAITETLFYAHAEVKKRVLQCILDVTKTLWKSGKKISYVLDDMGKGLAEITDDNFLHADIGVFVSNSASDMKTLRTIQELSMQYLQAKEISLADFISIVKTNSTAEAEHIAKDAALKSEQRLQEQQQLQQQQLEIQKQTTEQTIASQATEKEKDRELRKYEIDKKTETDLTIAEIRAAGQVTSFRPDVPTDTNSNGVLDVVEIERLGIEKTKNDLKDRELDIKEKQIKQKGTEK